MRKAALALAVLSPWFLGGWAAAKDPSITMSLDAKTGQYIPKELPHPETWICLGSKWDSEKALRQVVWVKPLTMTPRALTNRPKGDAAVDQLNAQLLQPLELPPPPHSEEFEYLDLFRRWGETPPKYLEKLKNLLSKDCPSASVTPLTMTDTELMVEVKSGGCQSIGGRVDIDRILFGKRDLFTILYRVNAPEMTPEQRESGIKAVTAWTMQ
jgi:hypothetical protein